MDERMGIKAKKRKKKKEEECGDSGKSKSRFLVSKFYF